MLGVEQVVAAHDESAKGLEVVELVLVGPHAVVGCSDAQGLLEKLGSVTVSYTPLTLPTSDPGEISGGPGSLKKKKKIE